MKEDSPLQGILKQIHSYTIADYRVRGTISEDGSEYDDIISALNSLGEILKEKSERIDVLLEVMLNYTIMEFSGKAPISENRDEIDALATGINALGEEMRHSRENQIRVSKELEIRAGQLEDANNELESFTYSVSHDLRSPLRAIHGYSQIMHEDCSESLKEDCKRALDAIMHNAMKMGKLIDNLLAFSKLGRKELSKSRVDTEQIVKSIVKPYIESENYDVKFIIHSLPVILADYSLMVQVFENLISNAVKYSAGKKEPVVEIGTVDTEHGLAIYVKDNGAGFNMEYYDKLFGVFQRLHRDDEFEGTGVGLPIVQRIVSRHGGNVWAEGYVGKGSTFYLTVNELKGQ